MQLVQLGHALRVQSVDDDIPVVGEVLLDLRIAEDRIHAPSV
jgi:hypothetical protein